jgi:chromosomal replication initiator protein
LALPAHPDIAHVWSETCAQLRQAVGESIYEIWLAPLEPESWDGRVLTVRAPADTRGWVTERFGVLIGDCAQQALGDCVRVDFASDPGGTRRPSYAGTRAPDPAASIAPAEAFNPRYSFDQFVIGEGNQLAHAAALAVSENPGQALNPLFLHAPPGLGKTHLLHAIGNYVLAFGGGASVRYTTIESFTNNFVHAITSHSLDRFKHAYRDADVLLIDDVQFLASKVKTEEEFFHTFNAVYETGRQLVLTCDRVPRDLVSIEERLRERFESGLVATIAPPDFATRVTILRKRAAIDRIPLGDLAVLELIAARVTDNVRALEGALIRIVAHHSLTGRTIDLALATAVLDEIHPAPGGSASIDDIQDAVAQVFTLTVDELRSPSRAARIAWPRQLAMYLCRQLTDASLPVIGRAFGGRDHATVHYALRRVGDRLRDDPGLPAQIASLTELATARQVDRDD